MADDRQDPRRPVLPFIREIPKDVKPEWLWNHATDVRDYLQKLIATTRVPVQVSDLTATRVGTAVRLNWSLNGAASYRIYRSLTPAFDVASLIAVVPFPNTFFVDDYQSSLTARTYWIQGVNALDNIGPLSAGVSFTPTTTEDWKSYTATVTSSTGSLTTVAGTVRYSVVGKTCFVYLNILITTNGTGATSIVATLPYTPAVDAYGTAGTLSGRQEVGGNALQGRFTASGAELLRYDNAYPGSSGERLLAEGFFEVA